MEGNFARLAFIASLRDPATRIYAHKQLSAAYGSDRVHEALTKCHEELFERVLELPLATQEAELRLYLNSLHPPTNPDTSWFKQNSEAWLPPMAPDYLKALFQSNLNALADLLRAGKPKARSNKS